MNNKKWSIVSLIVSTLVVLVGLHSINIQAEQFTGARLEWFRTMGYSFTFTTSIFFVLLSIVLRTKKG